MPMPVRTLPPLKLQHAPLVLVVAQARISPVLRMETFIPDIQENLRSHGLPRFNVAQAQELVLGPQLQFSMTPQWTFADKDGREEVVVSPSAVTVLTKEYDTFDTFSERLQQILGIVGEATDVALCERLGLRYVDLVRVGENEELADYLKPGLIGIPAEDLKFKKILYRFEARGATSVGEMVLRAFQTQDGTFLPPDLVTTQLKFDVELDNEEFVTVLDFDHGSVAPRDFEPSALIRSLWDLHDSIDLAFRASITETALERWGATSAKREEIS